MRPTPSLFRSSASGEERKSQHHHQTVRLGVERLYPAIMDGNNVLRNGQAKPPPLATARLIGPVEGLKEMGQNVFRHAWAFIPYVHQQLPLITAQRNMHLLSRRRMIQGILKDIVQRTLDEPAIP